MRIEDEIKLDFKDVLIRPKRSGLKSRSEVQLSRAYKFLHSGNGYVGIPIIAANMDTVGTFEMATELDKHSLSVALHKHYSVDELKEFFKNYTTPSSFYSLGTSDKDLDKFNQVNDECYIENVCIDVANGYSEHFLDFVKKFRDANPQKTIMAGNVVTAEMTEALILAGADIVKVGIGPGSVCTTRVKTGVGYPQLSAIIECADAAHGLGGHICGDGGITREGDLGKAFGAGADFVMMGGMFAGHTECTGEIVYDDGTPVSMKYYGMSSKEAMDKHSGGVASYRASEGKCVEVPFKGPVENTVNEMLGGLRSTCTYVGAHNLKALPRRTTFIRVSVQENQIYK